MWQTELSTIVRHLINDTDFTSPTYPDERIEMTILVAAQLISTEVDFEQVYTINVDSYQISPDPTTTDAKDDGFINLVSLKAATIIAGSEYKAYSLGAIRVSDGPSSIDTSSIAANLRQLYESLLKRFEQAKLNFAAGNNDVGQAVLSPYGSYWNNLRGGPPQYYRD
jgi:hypothetical protein